MQAGRLFFIRTSCQDGAIITHVTTCQGHDHIVTTRSRGRVLVEVHVHFEPDLVLRDLRQRLRRISLHWPRYPEAFGVIIGDFNVCEPERREIQLLERNLHRG